jgi:lipoprotein LprG
VAANPIACGVSPSRILRTLLLVVLALALAPTLGCSSKKPAKPAAGDLPDPRAILADSVVRLGQVKTVRFAIETDGPVNGIPLRKAGGQLTREGNAQGSLQLDQAGSVQELQFVILDGQAYIKGATGGWQSVPASVAATVYDPGAILDPSRGLAKLLESARNLRAEAREEAEGVEAYRVSASFDPQVVAALVPGASADVTGQVWIGVESKLPVRVRFKLPSSAATDGATVTARFSEYDKPVTITKP